MNSARRAVLRGKVMNTQETTCERQSLFIRGRQFWCAQRRLRTSSFLWAALMASVVLLALPGASFAQSVLTDDAHTSTAPKTTDSNFGTNPNLFVSPAGNV